MVWLYMGMLLIWAVLPILAVQQDIPNETRIDALSNCNCSTDADVGSNIEQELVSDILSMQLCVQDELEKIPLPTVRKMGLSDEDARVVANQRNEIFMKLYASGFYPPKSVVSTSYATLHQFTATAVLLQYLYGYENASSKGNTTALSPTLYQEIKNHLFPWLHHRDSLSEFYNQSIKWQRSILMCIGNRYYPMAVAGIRVIREVYKCDLPIEVFFTGDSDLRPSRQAQLSSMPNVHLRNLSEIMDVSALQLEGYAIKPLSIPFSWAREVLVVDADAVLFKHPMTFFEHSIYRNNGALFFKDRIEGSGKGRRAWLDQVVPSKSARMTSNQMYKGLSFHMMESTCLAVNRDIGQSALLLVALLNSPMHLRELTFRTLGDKEAFWISYELMGLPYDFHPWLTGVSGTAFNTVEINGALHGTLCHQLLHFDDDGQPWYNDGGYLYNKRDSHSKHEPFSHIISYGAPGFQYVGACFRGQLETPPESAVKVYDTYRAIYNPDV